MAEGVLLVQPVDSAWQRTDVLWMLKHMNVPNGGTAWQQKKVSS